MEINMTAKSMVGAPNEAPSAFVLADLVGTETITATIGAGKVGIIVDSGVVLNSHTIDVIVEQLRDAFREQVTKLL